MIRFLRPRPVLLAAALALPACSASVDSAPATLADTTGAEAGATVATTTTPSTTPSTTLSTTPTTTPTTTPATTPATTPGETSDAATTTAASPSSTTTAAPTTAAATTTAPSTTAPTTTLPPAPVTPDPPLTPVGQDSGPETRRAQEFLLELGFWLQEANGDFEKSTAQAVMAFQKYYGLETDGHLGPLTAEAMNGVAERPTGRSDGGTLVEVDKSKQLLFIVRDGVTEWVLNTSTGSEIPYREPDQNTPGEWLEDDSITRPGVFAVNRQREEGWWEGDLGEIYRPKYFDGGIALHGSYNIPDYPASHGCVRLSIPAMDWIWDNDIVPMGTTVWVHGEIPGADEALDA